ncbi:transmembrane and immunoglobulin domain-containing protein 1 [Pseudophryne corroboree]|uniref:transmembrane and immunoglobulin domain-containing protein 1 n=1 Tax=Pseudophryne corroboree TaxID=495146 RepID=UPI003081497F
MTKSLLLTLLLFVSYPLTATAIELLMNNKAYDDQLTLNISESANLRCDVTSNTADETLIWYRGTQQVNIKSENSVNTSNVCIPELTTADNGVSFTCLLKSNTTIKRSLQLNVLFSPELTGDSQITVEVGKNVQITCGFKANPAAIMFWRQNGRVFTLTSRYSVSMTTNSLQLSITKAEMTDTANYSCVALTDNGNETISVFELIVEDRKAVLPVEAIAAAVVVGALIIAFGLFARRDHIIKCKKSRHDTAM